DALFVFQAEDGIRDRNVTEVQTCALPISVLAPVSRSCPDLTGRLPTCYSPVRRSFHKFHPEGINLLPALDLHVLGTPPAFVLSQIGRASCRERGAGPGVGGPGAQWRGGSA